MNNPVHAIYDPEQLFFVKNITMSNVRSRKSDIDLSNNATKPNQNSTECATDQTCRARNSDRQIHRSSRLDHHSKDGPISIRYIPQGQKTSISPKRLEPRRAQQT